MDAAEPMKPRKVLMIDALPMGLLPQQELQRQIPIACCPLPRHLTEAQQTMIRRHYALKHASLIHENIALGKAIGERGRDFKMFIVENGRDAALREIGYKPDPYYIPNPEMLLTIPALPEYLEEIRQVLGLS